MEGVKVMTFNLRGARGEQDGDNAWVHRRELNVATIKKNDPDLIGFQEYQIGNQAVYDVELPEYDYEMSQMASHNGERAEYTPIYWRKSRFEKLDSGTFYLSKTPDVWSTGWDASLPRGALWCKFRELESGVEFIYLNAHLDHVGEQARVESAKMIVARMNALRAEGDVPVMVSADFNSHVYDVGDEVLSQHDRDLPPAGTVHKVFTDAGYQDTFYSGGNIDHPTTNTFHGFHGVDFPQIALRIDWILTLDGAQVFDVDVCSIIRDEAPPIYPSDHYPVVAQLNLD